MTRSARFRLGAIFGAAALLACGSRPKLPEGLPPPEYERPAPLGGAASVAPSSALAPGAANAELGGGASPSLEPAGTAGAGAGGAGAADGAGGGAGGAGAGAGAGAGGTGTGAVGGSA